MSFEENGYLITDKRSEDVGDTLNWETQSDWEAFQEKQNIDIIDGSVRLKEILFDPADKAIHHWKFDEGSGTTAADSIGSANGSIDGPSWVANSSWEGGHALNGGGGNDRVVTTSLGNFGSTVVPGDFAIAFTIEPQNLGSREDILGANNDSDNVIVNVNTNRRGTNDINFAFRDASGNELERHANNVLENNTKYRVVCNKRGNNASDVEVWINNTEQAVTWQDGGLTTNFNDFDVDWMMFTVGGRESDNFNGFLDNVYITNSALTVDEIESDYNQQPWT